LKGSFFVIPNLIWNPAIERRVSVFDEVKLPFGKMLAHPLLAGFQIKFGMTAVIKDGYK
jgi:hypothetical protein